MVLLRKKFRRFIIAVISPVIENENAITTPLGTGAQAKSMAWTVIINCRLMMVDWLAPVIGINNPGSSS
jgi:hypothetical protein